MFGIYKENKRLKVKIKSLEEKIEILKEKLRTSDWLKKFRTCDFCGWEVVYTWDDAHWIADIGCVSCWAKWFVNIMFMD